ncbi:Hypothetical protein D9617_27g045650 [Elsinoe fawcettii]|nr:Hypothetical protein D9617_27g045650 [Elsinoe fawcettii]
MVATRYTLALMALVVHIYALPTSSFVRREAMSVLNDDQDTGCAPAGSCAGLECPPACGIDGKPLGRPNFRIGVTTNDKEPKDEEDTFKTAVMPQKRSDESGTMSIGGGEDGLFWKRQAPPNLKPMLDDEVQLSAGDVLNNNAIASSSINSAVNGMIANMASGGVGGGVSGGGASQYRKRSDNDDDENDEDDEDDELFDEKMASFEKADAGLSLITPTPTASAALPQQAPYDTAAGGSTRPAGAPAEAPLYKRTGDNAIMLKELQMQRATTAANNMDAPESEERAAMQAAGESQDRKDAAALAAQQQQMAYASQPVTSQQGATYRKRDIANVARLTDMQDNALVQSNDLMELPDRKEQAVANANQDAMDRQEAALQQQQMAYAQQQAATPQGVPQSQQAPQQQAPRQKREITGLPTGLDYVKTQMASNTMGKIMAPSAAEQSAQTAQQAQQAAQYAAYAQPTTQSTSAYPASYKVKREESELMKALRDSGVDTSQPMPEPTPEEKAAQEKQQADRDAAEEARLAAMTPEQRNCVENSKKNPGAWGGKDSPCASLFKDEMSGPMSAIAAQAAPVKRSLPPMPADNFPYSDPKDDGRPVGAIVEDGSTLGLGAVNERLRNKAQENKYTNNMRRRDAISDYMSMDEDCRRLMSMWKGKNPPACASGGKDESADDLTATSPLNRRFVGPEPGLGLYRPPWANNNKIPEFKDIEGSGESTTTRR